MSIKKEIEKLLREYNERLWEIDNFVFETKLSYGFFQDKYQELLKLHNSNDEGMALFTKLNSKIPNHTKEINVFALINAVARTEAYLNDVLENLFLWNINSLKSEKTITYKELIDFNNIDDLIKSLINHEIIEFSHASIEKKIQLFNKKFNLTFPELEEIKSKIIEIFTTRNIILHNNGIVNQIYIDQNKETNLILGSKRVIEEDYISDGIMSLRILGFSIYTSVMKKIDKNYR